MAMVPYKGTLAKKNKNKNKNRRGFSVEFNPNAMLYNLGLGAVEGAGNLAVRGIRGIVSAFQQRGVSRSEIKTLIAPLAASVRQSSRQPKFMRADGGLMIEHVEAYPLSANGHTSFVINSNTFPWLRSIANNFEEYKIKLVFVWNPICPATTAGSVMMAFDYDPSDTQGYDTYTDYFNTADHCVSSLWSDCVVSPKISKSLKTGSTGDVRLYSPGMFHISVTDYTTGYLTVKYQVALVKPQPSVSANEAFITGTFATSNNIFSNAIVSGDQGLLSNVSSNALTIAPTNGWKIVVWSTDGNFTGFTPSLTNMDSVGTRFGIGTVLWWRCAPNTTGIVSGIIAPAPGGSTSYKVSVVQLGSNPLYF